MPNPGRVVTVLPILGKLGLSHALTCLSRPDQLSMLIQSLLVFVRFPVKAYGASIFLNKHAVDMFNEFLFFLGNFEKNLPAPPIHYAIFDLFGSLTNFGQTLLVGVAFEKAPILTQFLVKQTKFALMQSPPSPVCISIFQLFLNEQRQT